MKILNTGQIREADQYTIQNEPISSLDLMERAARRCFNFIDHDYHYNRFAVFCGPGNNGGDGLVIARLLAERGKFTEVFIVRFTNSESPDFTTNLTRLKAFDNVRITDLTESGFEFSLHKSVVVIDALFGSGLSRPIDGFTSDIVKKINELDNVTLSIDAPSGLFNDLPVSKDAVIIEATKTYTFERPKLSHMFPENYRYTGEWEVVNIGLSKKFMQEATSDYFYVSKNMVSKMYRSRGLFDHKGTFGHVLMIAGQKGSMGAATLTGKASLRAGVGLTTMHVPGTGLEIVQHLVPEAMCSIDESEHYFTKIFTSEDLEAYSAVGIGPGIGQESGSVKALQNLLQIYRKPMVIDADAVNILSKHKDWLHDVPENTILTPHLKEFERLVGKCENHFIRLEKVQQFCAAYKVYMVLKGHYSMIGTPSGEVYFNSTGNSGMATAGSGDVLTGIISGLLAQGYLSREAAIMGVYLHGNAGDLALSTQSKESLMAGDIIENLGNAYKLISNT